MHPGLGGDSLTLEVVFPLGFEPSGEYFDVWYGEVHVTHDLEYQYLRKNIKESRDFHGRVHCSTITSQFSKERRREFSHD